MRLAVIPARGGSKRIPRKNIRLFAGQPMIAYAIDAARSTGLFDHVIISTEDAEIAAIGRALGAEIPFMRPVELADDTTPTVPVVAHAIRSCRDLGWPVLQACCIYPTAPLLDPRDIEAAFRMLDDQDSPYVFPVAEYASPVQRALRRAGDGCTQPLFPEFVRTRTQDLEPSYHDAGQFYAGQAQAWIDELDIHAHSRTLVLPALRVADIDTPADWERAEALFRVWKGAAA